MNRPLPIFFAARARRELAEAGRWWREHRDKAPRAFEEEVRKALELIAHQPSVGARASNVRLNVVRRLLLGRVQYYLYYRLGSDESRLEVLAVWHASRGSAPHL